MTDQPEQVEGESDQSRRRRYAGKIPPKQVEGERMKIWTGNAAYVEALQARIEALTAALHLMAADYAESEGKRGADTTLMVDAYVNRAALSLDQ